MSRTDEVLSHIYDGLLGFDPNGRIINRLAEDLTWRKATVLRLSLRKGVKFHDGTPFDARTVVWNFDTLQRLGERCPRGFLFANLERAEQIGSHTVDLHLHGPDGTFENLLAAFSWMVPIRELEGPEWQRLSSHPVGTGPYRIEPSESASELRMVPFENYWGKPASFQAGIRWMFLSESLQIEMLLAGKLDLLGSVRPLFHAKIQRAPELEVVKTDSLVEVDAVFNCSSVVGGDIRIRKAVAHAVNTEDLIRYVARGNGRPMHGSGMNGQLGHDPDGPVPAFDPALARQLVRSVAGEKRVVLKGVLDPEFLILGRSLKAQLSKVGIDLELETATRPEIFNRVVRPKLEGKPPWGGDLFISPIPDPTYHYYFVNSLSNFGPGPWTMCADDSYDATFKKMIAARSPTVIQAQCRKLDALITENRPKLHLYQVRRGYAVRRQVGFRPARSGMLDLRHSGYRKLSE